MISSPGRLRVATLNLFSGRAPGPRGPVGVADDSLTDALAGLDADVLALQEVDVAQPRSGLTDQLELAARALHVEPGQAAYAPTVVGTPGEGAFEPASPRVAVFDPQTRKGQEDPSPRYGIGLVSRRPVASWARMDLGRVRGRFPLPVAAGVHRPQLAWLPEEPRVVLAARLTDPAITVASAHLTFVPGASIVQLRRARAWLAATFPPPYLLLGDLNVPTAATIGQGWTCLARTPTYPATRPRLQLDHVLGRDLDGWRVEATGARRLAVGDHLALTVDLVRGGA